ncbi:MAG: hypothetical protein DRP87_06710 [Spirochaetes bacterium]|nr:MAG: hypothetical protein DRP87_06710 [Spirochaetota bacterium]
MRKTIVKTAAIIVLLPVLLASCNNFCLFLNKKDYDTQKLAGRWEESQDWSEDIVSSPTVYSFNADGTGTLQYDPGLLSEVVEYSITWKADEATKTLTGTPSNIRISTSCPIWQEL